MEAVITLLICTVIPAIAAISMHFKFAHERWVSYLEQKSSYKYITVSPKIFGTMLCTLSYEMCALPYGIMGIDLHHDAMGASLSWCTVEIGSNKSR